MRALHLSLAIIWPIVTSCGSQVSTGRNATFAQSPNNDASSPPIQNAGSANSVPGTVPSQTQPNSSPQPGTAPISTGAQQQLTCFGPSPDLPSYLQDFCANSDSDLKTTFKTSFQLICEQKLIVNLFRDGCGWNGNAADRDNFIRIVQATGLNDPSPDYYYLAAFSVNAATTTDVMTKTVISAYTDPNYSQKYQTIKNSKITNASYNDQTKQLDYTAQLASSAAVVSFTGRINFKNYGNVTVLFDRDISNQVIIKYNHYVQFYVPTGTGTRVVVIDEKLVTSGGNQSIAQATALSVDQQRMDAIYANALIH